MPDKADIRAEAMRLRALFEELGAAPVETDVLQSAETLLDLYGEDIRGRAYVTSDPVRGETMLRPDFTVPVAEMHILGQDNGTARYTYSGEVFRQQDGSPGRASEYVQVGYEVLAANDPINADADVFAAFADILAPLNLRAATGDIGLLTAAVEGLSTSERRKRALKRHIWRPQRFRSLLDRFGGRTSIPTSRQKLIDSVDPFSEAVPEIGLRTKDEVLTRIAALKADAEEPPISTTELECLEALLSVRDAAPSALSRLRNVAVEFLALARAVDRFEARLDALQSRGIEVADVQFEASYGRTSMEYYDGFVFGFYADGRPDFPPVATGGRYDALMRELDSESKTAAVGGVIRPAVVLELRGAD